MSVGPDSAELLIAVALGRSHLPYYWNTLKWSHTYSWNNSTKILNNQISTLRKSSGQKMRVSPFRLPCFASGPLICPKPGLICNFVQGIWKTSKATLLTRTNSAQYISKLIQVMKKTGESRLLPGGPSSSEGSSTRTYTPYLPTTSQ